MQHIICTGRKQSHREIQFLMHCPIISHLKHRKWRIKTTTITFVHIYIYSYATTIRLIIIFFCVVFGCMRVIKKKKSHFNSVNILTHTITASRLSWWQATKQPFVRRIEVSGWCWRCSHCWRWQWWWWRWRWRWW